MAELASDYARVFNDSYERIMYDPRSNAGEFYAEFYAVFIEANPEAAGKFKNTDMKTQVRMLRASVALLLAYFATGEVSDGLRTLAERHSKRGADIPPSHYAIWLDCLIAAVRRYDPKFNEDVASAWRTVFSKGIEFMISKYE